MTAVLAAFVVLEALALMWQAWPADGGYQPRHLAGRNPAADDLERAMSANKRDLRRSPAPWAPPTKRNSDRTQGDL